MKTVLYSRVSTDKQSNGLEAQTRALTEYCNTRGIADYEIYEDFNISGVKLTRPQLDRLMEDVRSGKVDTVIVYSFSRFARSTRFLLESLEEFSGLEVNFISLSENIDLSTPMGRAMFTIISAIATLERELIGERVRNGIENARAKGKSIGRPRSIPDDVIISLVNEGYSYRKISKMLNISQGSITNALRRAVHKNLEP
jgi:DNA invertase Pin-like site-specific DNA recombinase